jgi:hypothetical protein
METISKDSTTRHSPADIATDPQGPLFKPDLSELGEELPDDLTNTQPVEL